jgi:hypothetical protein
MKEISTAVTVVFAVLSGAAEDLKMQNFLFYTHLRKAPRGTG